MTQGVKNEWRKNGDFHFSSHKISCQYGKLGKCWRKDRWVAKNLRGGLWETRHGHRIRRQVRVPVKVKVWLNAAGGERSRGHMCVINMSCCCSWCVSFVSFVYLRQLLQPQLHPLQDRVGVTDGRFGVFPLVFESAANTTCITTQTQRSEGSRYFLSHFWMCLVLLPQFTLSHDTTVFNRAIIIHFMHGDAHRHTVWREFIWQMFSWRAFWKTRTYLKHRFLQLFI